MNPLTWLPKIKMWLVAAVAAVAFVGSVYLKGRNEGRSDAEGEIAKETVKRVDAGAKGAASARKAQREGRTPEEGVRSRDGNWQ